MGVEENKEKRPSSYHGRENAETKKYRFIGNCHYCHKKGHQEAKCHIKQHDNANNVEEEHALMMTYCTHKENAEIWIGDTCHMKSSTEGMYNLEKCYNIKIDTANGSMSNVTHIRKYKMEKPRKSL